jgi:hypothetical protein
VPIRETEQQWWVAVDIGSLNNGASERWAILPKAPWGEELLQASSFVLCHVQQQG